MQAIGNYVRVKDSAANKKGYVLHWFEPAYQEAMTAVAGAQVAAAWAVPALPKPAPQSCYAIVAYDDLTIAIQTLDKLTVIA